VWLRRQRRDYEEAAVMPSTVTPASEASVIRRYAAWGGLYLLFALLVASATPDFLGLGFACAVFAGALA
jgi:drug/metabolite transporter superfamily protein YnfA